MKGYLLFEDGDVLEGKAFGDTRTRAGEICFCTHMAGYENILTDPVNSNLIINMTYPLIGNYGFSKEDIAKFDSNKGTMPMGMIVKDYSEAPNHFECVETIAKMFERYGIFGLSYGDTRFVTRKITQSTKPLRCLLTTEQPTTDLLEKHFKAPTDGVGGEIRLSYGASNGCADEVLPYSVKADVLLKTLNEKKPQAIHISHAGGSMDKLTETIDAIKSLVEYVRTTTSDNQASSPQLTATGLGALLLAMAASNSEAVKPVRLANGYRGTNYPVMDKQTGKVFMADYSMGYAIPTDALPDALICTHININDNTVAGFMLKDCTNIKGRLFNGGDANA